MAVYVMDQIIQSSGYRKSCSGDVLWIRPETQFQTVLSTGTNAPVHPLAHKMCLMARLINPLARLKKETIDFSVILVQNARSGQTDGRIPPLNLQT